MHVQRTMMSRTMCVSSFFEPLGFLFPLLRVFDSLVASLRLFFLQEVFTDTTTKANHASQDSFLTALSTSSTDRTEEGARGLGTSTVPCWRSYGFYGSYCCWCCGFTDYSIFYLFLTLWFSSTLSVLCLLLSAPSPRMYQSGD